MQNSMVMFTFFFFGRKYPFWANLVQKIKIVSFETWYHAKFEYAEFNDALHFFCFGPEIPFWSKSGRKKNKIVSLRWNLILRLIEYAKFSGDVRFLRFRLEILFLGKFGPKNQNDQFKVKLDTWTYSNMQNSMVMFTFFVFDRKYLFWANLVQNVKIISLSRNLVPILIRICKIQWCCWLFSFLTKNVLFGQI